MLSLFVSHYHSYSQITIKNIRVDKNDDLFAETNKQKRTPLTFCIFKLEKKVFSQGVTCRFKGIYQLPTIILYVASPKKKYIIRCSCILIKSLRLVRCDILFFFFSHNYDLVYTTGLVVQVIPDLP